MCVCVGGGLQCVVASRLQWIQWLSYLRPQRLQRAALPDLQVGGLIVQRGPAPRGRDRSHGLFADKSVNHDLERCTNTPRVMHSPAQALTALPCRFYLGIMPAAPQSTPPRPRSSWATPLSPLLVKAAAGQGTPVLCPLLSQMPPALHRAVLLAPQLAPTQEGEQAGRVKPRLLPVTHTRHKPARPTTRKHASRATCRTRPTRIKDGSGVQMNEPPTLGVALRHRRTTRLSPARFPPPAGAGRGHWVVHWGRMAKPVALPVSKRAVDVGAPPGEARVC